MNNPFIISIGEVLIDLVSSAPAGDLSTATLFRKMAGGGPANVAVGLAKLGIASAFIGKVGIDPFGRFLRSELKLHGVETKWMVDDPDHKTRLAFVAVTESGERDFEFWENDPADQHLRIGEINPAVLQRANIVNIGSFLLLQKETRATALSAAKTVRRAGNWVCFDPNIRLSLWPDTRTAVKNYLALVRLSTILRLNEQEARMLSGTKRTADAMRKLLSMGPDIVVVTQDKKGCLFATKHVSGSAKGFSVKALDTTGCGDGFLSGLLAGILRSGRSPGELSRDELSAICRTANAVGALVATQKGAIAAMPSLTQVQQLLRSSQ
jgi:fructokinase